MPRISIHFLQHRQRIKSLITVILAVSLSFAKAQYHLPPSVEQQEYSYPPQDSGYYQPEGQYDAYQQQSQRVNQVFDNGARSSSTFSFGPRKVAVQVNHHSSDAFVDYNGQHGAPGYQFRSAPAERSADNFPQNYQFQDNIPSQNNFATSNIQRSAVFGNQRNYFSNQQNEVQNPYSITNPINGQQFSLNQPTWSQSAYDVNINYKNQEQPQSATPPPLHNFQFHNNFVPQTSFLNPFSQRNPPQQSGYIINNGQVYSEPPITNFQSAFHPSIEYNIPSRPQYSDNVVNNQNRPKAQQKLVYTRPTSDNLSFRFNTPGSEVPQVNAVGQGLTEVPSFESAKLTTKQEIVRNTTVLTLIEEDVQTEAVVTTTTPATVFEPTPAAIDLPVVEDAKVKSRPSPTIVQPTTPEYKSPSQQYYDNLVNVPDYSSLYRSQPNPTQTVSHNFNLYFQPTPGIETSSPVTPVDQRLQQPGDYYVQTTPRPQQQREFVFYQSTPNSAPNNFQRLLPGQINNGLSSNGNPPEFNPVEDKNQRVETLFSVNGFEETTSETTTEKASTYSNGISIGQAFPSRYEKPKVTEGSVVTEKQLTTELPQTTTTAASLQNIISETTIGDSLLNRNGFQFTTPRQNINNQRVSNEKPLVVDETFLSGRLPSTTLRNSNGLRNSRIRPAVTVKENLLTTVSDISNFEVSTSTESNQDSLSNQKLYYNFVSSSTSSATTGTDENAATEANIPVSRGPSVETQSTTSNYDREAALRRKKIRVYKKPTIDLQDLQQSITIDRANKNRNEYRGRRIRPNQQNTITTSTSLPETTQRVIPRGRYHASIPQRSRVNLQRTTQSIINETPFLPTAIPEYNQETNPPPISLPVPTQRGQSRFTQPETTNPTREFKSEKTFQTSTPSVAHLPNLRYQIQQRGRSTVPQNRQDSTTPMTDDAVTTTRTEFTSRIQSNIRQETIRYEQTHQTEPTVDNTEPTREPEQVFTSQRTRPRGPYNRGQGEGLRKQERPVFSLKKHNFNGRLRVMNPDSVREQDEQSDERRQVSYHPIKHSPQRQMVIRRIKVKSNHRSESSEMDDQDASGSIRTSYKNQLLQESLNKKLPTATVRNSILFPPRKPLNRFRISSTTEQIHELNTETNLDQQSNPNESDNSDNHDIIHGTTITDQEEVHQVTTERIEIHQESTTTRVTEKRQTFDDPDLKDLVENTQSLQEEREINEGQNGQSLTLKEQNIKLDNEPSEHHHDEMYSAEEQKDSLNEQVDEYIMHALPVNLESSSETSTGILANPIESEVVPSVIPGVEPSQNPSDIVTRIDIVTSISEEGGPTHRDENISEVNEFDELV